MQQASTLIAVGNDALVDTCDIVMHEEEDNQMT